MTNTSSSKRRSLSTLITKIIILVLAPIILGIFVQSYYFSKQIIWQEVDRTKQQTSALILNIFDSHFAAIQIHHDSNSKSDVVLNFYSERDEEALNFFFLALTRVILPTRLKFASSRITKVSFGRMETHIFTVSMTRYSITSLAVLLLPIIGIT